MANKIVLPPFPISRAGLYDLLLPPEFWRCSFTVEAMRTLKCLGSTPGSAEQTMSHPGES